MAGRASVLNDMLVVTTTYDPQGLKAIKRAGGKWVPALRGWQLPLTTKSLDVLNRIGIYISEEVYEALEGSWENPIPTDAIPARAGVAKVLINSNICMKNPGPDLVQEVQREMTIKNPAYENALKHYCSVANIPEYLQLYEYNPEEDTLTVPRGYAKKFLYILRAKGVRCSFIDRRVKLPEVDFHSKTQLRSYQKRAVQAVLKSTQGILEAPAGSGKTIMGLEIVARVKQPTLWLTHTKDLAMQTINRAVTALGIPAKEIGLIGAGQEKIGHRLTVAILQKLNNSDIDSIADKFGLVIIDEVHHTPAATWSAVINRLPAYYRYGVTATPERADGLRTVMEHIIGPILYTVTREQVRMEGGLVTPELRVIETPFSSPTWEKYLVEQEKANQKGWLAPPVPYAQVLAELLESPERNNFIADILSRECPGHSSLVLSERISHCEVLAALLHKKKPDIKTAVVHGKLSKKKREEIIQQMSEGDLDVLFAVDIAKEGLDIPRLDRLFLVAGGRNPAEIEQKVGRIQRVFPGKKDAVVFDFVDSKIGVLLAQFNARRRVYGKLNIKEREKSDAMACR